MKKKKIIGIAIAAVAIIAIAVVLIIVLGRKEKYRVVKVEDFRGEVTVERTAKSNLTDAFKGMKLMNGDLVSVGDDSELELLMDTDKHMIAEAGTSFELKASGTSKSGKISINILSGSSLFEIDNKLNADSTFEVSTPNAVFSVRGTKFIVSYDKENNETKLEVIKGVVAVEYNNGAEDEEINADDGRIINENAVYDFNNNVIKEDVTSSDNNSSTGNGSTVQLMTNVSSDVAAYNEIISNMKQYLAEITTKGHDYTVLDYMYFDYDEDGRKELILYPRFANDESDNMRDIVFLDYNEENKSIDVIGINYNEYKDSSFYVEYNGKLARYSWNTSIYESYLYIVVISDNLTYVLENSYDNIIGDVTTEGMNPLILYGDWEMIFED